MHPLEKTSKIVVVGAGVFGLSTASHLLQRGYTSITVLDRSEIIPAPDAASCDINKVVRGSYSDIFYTKLAREAIDLWKNEEVWGDTYHECGVFVVRSSPLSTAKTYKNHSAYSDTSHDNDLQLGARIDELASVDAIRSIFPPDVPLSNDTYTGAVGYLNRDGGWAAAAMGVERLLRRVTKDGGTVLGRKTVVELVKAEGIAAKTVGVRCADGTVYDADLVVIASGSWTPSAFPMLDLKGKCLATGQTVVTVQLTQEEGERYRKCPIILDFSGGFCIFPPNGDNIVKMGLHNNGFLYNPPSSGTNAAVGISTPRTSLSDGNDGLRVPKEVLRTLRTHLRAVYPELGEKPFSGTRLCWYNDSPDEDWVIGYHPEDKGVVLATAGSGHAYKFLPNIGKLVADAIEGKLDDDVRRRFALEREVHTNAALSRSDDPSRELDLNELCDPEDLLP